MPAHLIVAVEDTDAQACDEYKRRVAPPAALRRSAAAAHGLAVDGC